MCNGEINTICLVWHKNYDAQFPGERWPPLNSAWDGHPRSSYRTPKLKARRVRRSRRWRPIRARRRRWRKRSSRTTRPVRWQPRLAGPRRWGRGIRTGYPNTEARRGYPKGTREQGTSDYLFDLHVRPLLLSACRSNWCGLGRAWRRSSRRKAGLRQLRAPRWRGRCEGRPGRWWAPARWDCPRRWWRWRWHAEGTGRWSPGQRKQQRGQDRPHDQAADARADRDADGVPLHDGRWGRRAPRRLGCV